MDKAAAFMLKIWEAGCRLMTVAEAAALLRAQSSPEDLLDERLG